MSDMRVPGTEWPTAISNILRRGSLHESPRQNEEGRSAAGTCPARPAPSMYPGVGLQRPKFIAPISPNDVLPPSSPIGMLMLGLRLNRELNTNPVPRVSSA